MATETTGNYPNKFRGGIQAISAVAFSLAENQIVPFHDRAINNTQLENAGLTLAALVMMGIAVELGKRSYRNLFTSNTENAAPAQRNAIVFNVTNQGQGEVRP